MTAAFVVTRRRSSPGAALTHLVQREVRNLPRFGVKTVCGEVMLDPSDADIETAERFCDWCLLGDIGHVVYTFLGADGPLYVGQTSDLPRRIQRHVPASAWWPDVIRVDYARVPDRATALRVERETIGHLNPPHNVRGRTA